MALIGQWCLLNIFGITSVPLTAEREKQVRLQSDTDKKLNGNINKFPYQHQLIKSVISNQLNNPFGFIHDDGLSMKQ